MNYPELLSERIQQPADGWMTVASQLRHFALITYALPVQTLQRLLPESLRLLEFPIHGQAQGLISMAVFLNQDFHFPRFAYLPHCEFGQTNYRVYITDPRGEPGLWFLGTSLGSLSYLIPRLAWQMPWDSARYRFDCSYRDGGYEKFGIETLSDWGQASIRLTDTAQPMPLLPGFMSLPEQQLLLTHPVTGYFTRPDGKLSQYKIWHPPTEMTLGAAENLYFRPLEKAGLLSASQMQQPHSVLIQQQIPYRIYLPPHRL